MKKEVVMVIIKNQDNPNPYNANIKLIYLYYFLEEENG